MADSFLKPWKHSKNFSGAVFIYGLFVALIVVVILFKTMQNERNHIVYHKVEPLFHYLEAVIEDQKADLSQQDEINELIKFTYFSKGKNPDILSIEIFNEDGVELFNSDLAMIGYQIPLRWVLQNSDKSQAFWTLDDYESRIVGRPLYRGDNPSVGKGGIIIRYVDRVTENDRLLTYIVIASGVFAFGAFLLLYYTILPFILKPVDETVRKAELFLQDEMKVTGESDNIYAVFLNAMKNTIKVIESKIQKINIKE